MPARFLRIALLLATSLLTLSAAVVPVGAAPVRAAWVRAARVHSARVHSARVNNARVNNARGHAATGRAATSGGWQVQAIISMPGDSVQLNSVAAVSRSDAWAAGGVAPTGSSRYQPLLVHWDGTAWQTVTLPARILAVLGPGQGLSVIGAWRAGGFWAFDGLNGTWLRHRGQRWTAGQLPAPGAGGSTPVITSAVVLSRANVWAFGFSIDRGGQAAPYAVHLRAGIWRVVALPGAASVTDASASSRHSIWALIGGGPQTATANMLLHWNAKQWNQVSMTGSLARSTRLYSVLAVGGSSAWIGGGTPPRTTGPTGPTGVAALWNGSGWQVSRLHLMLTPAVNVEFSLARDGQGGAWAAVGGFGAAHWQLWHYTGGQWMLPVNLNTTGTRAFLGGLARVPGTTSMWAVGERLVGTADQGMIAGYGQ
jgi:hypothetical protein